MIFGMLFLTISMHAQRQEGNGNKQQGPPPIPTTKQINHMVSDLADEISLTEKQEKEVLTIYTNHFKDLEDITKSGRPDRDEMQSFRKGFQNSVNEVLSEDQQELYATYMKEKRQARGNKKSKK